MYFKILFFIFFFINCALAENTARQLTAEEVALIKDKMETQLYDSESARYKLPELILTNTTGGANYCGLVNAKNTYGAYTGYTAFQLMFYRRNDNDRTDIAFLLLDSGNGAIKRTCQKNGYNL